jgi:hypothetical protein
MSTENLANLIRVNPDQNMKNDKCCSQLNTYLQRLNTVRKAYELLVCSDKNQKI